MCELLAMSSRVPATVRLSLGELARHGGLTGPHKDGWGVGFYDGTDARVFKDVTAASDSPWVEFLQRQPLASSIVLAHVRRLTQGTRTLASCQPFARELGGRTHLFAHNGDLDRARLPAVARAGARPLGDTDSEHAFCVLLDRLREPWLGDEPPTVEQRIAIVGEFAATLRPLGPANFLYSDGELLFAHGHIRTRPGGGFGPPGLHVLTRVCAVEPSPIEAPGLAITGAHAGEQRVVLVASVPLSTEGWAPLAEGELLVARAGAIVARVA
ncbi:MAG: class II glutamine amidotransferase [Myxococcales bacterium]|nr:class II glutamine amidotransferase [Myxococcales bacterium]